MKDRKEYYKQYYKDNLKKIKKNALEYRKKNKELFKKYRKKYRENPELRLKDFLRRKALFDSDSGLNKRWYRMKGRCNNPNNKSYKWYGGKGIKVEWKTYQDFKNDMYSDYLKHREIYGHKNTTIDRIDSSKNYCKENCRWATMQVQNNNKKNKRE